MSWGHPPPASKHRVIESLGEINTEKMMTDEHQVNSIIATALCDASKNHPWQMEPEQAKQIAKCIIEALADAGLQIASLRAP
jgi:hypothetical protein